MRSLRLPPLSCVLALLVTACRPGPAPPTPPPAPTPLPITFIGTPAPGDPIQVRVLPTSAGATGALPPGWTAITPGDLVDTGAPTGGTDLPAVAARVVFTTTAPTLGVRAFTTLYTAFPDYAAVGVRVNGADYAVLRCGANQAETEWSIALPTGSKQIELLAGIQSQPPGAPVLGTALRAVRAGGPITFLHPTPTPRLLVYGDSLAVGANAANLPLAAWPVQLRRSWSGSIALDAWGWRSLYDDAATAAQRTALVAQLTGYAPAVLWLAMGTNDYGLDRWSATAFGAAYAALLDALHAAQPALGLYAQTPIRRATEPANRFGDTLDVYRAQIATAAAPRPWVHLVDGPQLLGVADLGTDGVHPTSAGEARYAAAVQAVLAASVGER